MSDTLDLYFVCRVDENDERDLLLEHFFDVSAARERALELRDEVWLVPYSIPGIQRIEEASTSIPANGPGPALAITMEDELLETPEDQEQAGVYIHFVVMQETDSGETMVFRSFKYEVAASAYYDGVVASHQGKAVSLLTHRIAGVYSQEYVDELKTRISQTKLGNQVCSESLKVAREQVKKLEEENEVLKRVVRLTL